MRNPFRFVALLGIALAGVGFVLIVLGFDGAATQDIVSSQMPYVISGGLGGLALVVLGMSLALVHELRQQTGQLERKLDELTEALLATSAPRVGPTGVPDDASVVASHSTFHRADCHLIAERDDVQVMAPTAATSAGLTPCRICEPRAAAVS